jgi:hypothetical protein
MQCWCNFKKVSSKIEITPIAVIPYINGPINILKFYYEESKIAAGFTIQYCRKIVPHSYVNHVRRSMYYAGSIWFAKQYALFDVDKITDKRLFSKYLGEGVENLIVLFMTNAPISEEILRKSVQYNYSMSKNAATNHILIRNNLI